MMHEILVHKHLHINALKAEGEGFEPPEPCGSAVFKTAAIVHSATLPKPTARRQPILTALRVKAGAALKLLFLFLNLPLSVNLSVEGGAPSVQRGTAFLGG
jgi:hypothetical protein